MYALQWRKAKTMNEQETDLEAVVSDVRASADYRAEAALTVVRRLLAELAP